MKVVPPLAEARSIVDAWHTHDNHIHPPGSPGYVPPALFARYQKIEHNENIHQILDETVTQ